MKTMIQGGLMSIFGVSAIIIGKTIIDNDNSAFGTFFFTFGILIVVGGGLIFLAGLVQYLKNPTPSPTVETGASQHTPLFCTQCGEQILSTNFVCNLCKHDNSLDFFLRSADPAGRAAEINHAWYKFGLDKRYRAETKELASLVVQEQRQGKNEGANQAFLAKFR